MKHKERRKLINGIVLIVSSLSALFGIFWLTWILGTLIYKGISTISIETFIGDPPAPGEFAGGLKHAIVGQFIIVSIATTIGVPIGLLAGTYLSEYGRESKFAEIVRNLSDIMMSIPSIVVGTFVYAVMVKPAGHFMGIAGSVALAIMIIPIIVRTTDDMLRMVPSELREAAYALGATKPRVILSVVFRGAITGIVTGIILAVARIGGETAPLLFTSFNNNFFSTSIFKPLASLTVTMYDYAMSPYKYWQELAWASAVILTVAVLIFNLTGRLIARWRFNR